MHQDRRDRTPAAGAIENATTSTTVLVGPTRSGPSAASLASQHSAAEVLGDIADFERIYGGSDAAQDSGPEPLSYLAHAVRVYFSNGGTRLYVLRVTHEGSEPTVQDYDAALDALQYLEEPSLLAAPGYSAFPHGDAIQDALLARVGADSPSQLFLILDPPPHTNAQQMSDARSRLDNACAAIYYPWVTSGDMTAGRRGPQLAEVCLPPSAFVCGVLARNDLEHGVWKSAAQQELRGALGLEQPINSDDEQRLLSIGVNCLRSTAVEGTRIWGTRTTGSDADWQHVNVCRLRLHLQRSISRGLAWTASERNDATLWAAVRAAVFDFLYAQWQGGAFVGTRPDEAFFVRCDASTMTQDDIDSGRLICVIGVAVIKPAEFVSMQISRKVASLDQG
jgi:uncharacterized protein